MVNYAESSDYYVDLYTILGKKDGNLLDLIDFYAGNEKSMIEYGVSQDEIEAAKMLVRKRYHLDRPKKAESLRNEDFVGVCHNNFVSGAALTDPATLHGIQNRILKDISLEDVKPYVAKVFSESDKIYSWFANPKDLARFRPWRTPKPDSLRSGHVRPSRIS